MINMGNIVTLPEAADTNRLTDIKRLLLSGECINDTDGQGRTSLYCAARKNYLDILQFLLKQNADYRIREKVHNYTVLHVTCKKGFLKGVDMLLTHLKELLNEGDLRAFIDSFDEKGKTSLYHAVEYHHVDIVRCLLSYGADGTIAEQFGSTALHIATEQGFVDVLLNLLECGILPDIKTGPGSIKTIDQDEKGSAAKIRKVVQKRYEEGSTSLLVACEYNQLDSLKLLCQFGAAINAVDIEGNSGLHIAVINKSSIDIIAYLISKGIDINKNSLGFTAADIARSKGHDSIANVLLSYMNDKHKETNQYDLSTELKNGTAKEFSCGPVEIKTGDIQILMKTMKVSLLSNLISNQKIHLSVIIHCPEHNKDAMQDILENNGNEETCAVVCFYDTSPIKVQVDVTGDSWIAENGNQYVYFRDLCDTCINGKFEPCITRVTIENKTPSNYLEAVVTLHQKHNDHNSFQHKVKLNLTVEELSLKDNRSCMAKEKAIDDLQTAYVEISEKLMKDEKIAHCIQHIYRSNIDRSIFVSVDADKKNFVEIILEKVYPELENVIQIIPQEKDEQELLMLNFDDMHIPECFGPGSFIMHDPNLTFCNSNINSDVRLLNIRDIAVCEKESGWGSIGCFTQDPATRNVYALSVNHLIGKTQGYSEGSDTFMVSGFEHTNRIEMMPRIIRNNSMDIKAHSFLLMSKAYRGFYGRSDTNQFVDCALFGPPMESILKSHDDFKPRDRHRIAVEPGGNLTLKPVIKAGFRTGITKGIILSENHRKMENGVIRGYGTFLVASLTNGEPSENGKFGEQGDSGSLVLLDNNSSCLRGVGLIHSIMRTTYKYIHPDTKRSYELKNVIVCVCLKHCLEALQINWDLYFYHFKPFLSLREQDIPLQLPPSSALQDVNIHDREEVDQIDKRIQGT